MENKWMSFREAMEWKAWTIVQQRYMGVTGVPPEVLQKDFETELKKLTNE